MNLKLALRNQRVNYQQGANPNEIRICCLFCEERGESKDNRYRLGVNILTSRAQCFNCKWASRHAVEAIAAKLKFADVTVAGEQVQEKVTYSLPKDFELIDPNTKDYWHKKAYRYLQSRNITDEQIREKQIGVSLIGKYAYRIIFPVMVGGKLKGIVARSLINEEPRYLNAAGPKSLYNYPDEVRPIVVMSEGIIKALNIETALKGFCTSVTPLGNTLTDDQEDVLFKKRFRELVLWADPDKVGTREFLKLAERLSTKVQITLPWPAPLKQADEMEAWELAELYYSRIPYSENAALSMWNNAVRRRSDE